MKRLLLVLALLTGAASAQAFYRFPSPLPGATFRVCSVPEAGNPCSNVASIFPTSALTGAITQPVTIGADGNFGFWVSPGQYTIQVAAPFSLDYTISLGGGGGSGLTGCSTGSSGVLTCTTSVGVTTGTEGSISGSFSGLPAPPSSGTWQIAPDASGNMNYTPGSNTAFAPVMVANPANGLFPATNIDTTTVAPGFGAVFPLRSEFPDCDSLGWNTATSPAISFCADTFNNIQPNASYTLLTTDENSLLTNTFKGAVTLTLPAPSGTFTAPFVFWVDTACLSNLTLAPSGGATVNGNTTFPLPPCSWARMWADTDGLTWHAQAFTPPGGVVTIQ